MSRLALASLQVGALRGGFVTLGAAAAALLLACTVTGPITSLAPAGSSSTAIATATALPSSSATGSAPASSSADAPPSTVPPSAAPEDGAAAVNAATEYLQDLAGQRYADAWWLLADSSRRRFGSVEHFAAERAAFYRSAGPRFVLSAPDRSPAAIATWQPADFTGIAQRASLLRVEHPALTPNNAAWALLLVAPTASGAWRIWLVR